MIRILALLVALVALFVTINSVVADGRYGGIIVTDGADCLIEEFDDDPYTVDPLVTFKTLPINTLVNIFPVEHKWEGMTLIGIGPDNETCLVDSSAVEAVEYTPPIENEEEYPPVDVEEPILPPEEQEPVTETDDCSEGCGGEAAEQFLGDISVNTDGAACQVWPSWESETFTTLSSGVVVSQIADGLGDGWQKVRIYVFDEPADCYIRQAYLGSAGQEFEEDGPMPATVSAGTSDDTGGTATTTPPVVDALPNTGSGSARGMLSEMLGEAAMYAFAGSVCFIVACCAGYKERRDEVDAVVRRIWRPLAKACASTIEAMWLWPFAFGLLSADAIRAGNARLKSRRAMRSRRHARYALSHSQ